MKTKILLICVILAGLTAMITIANGKTMLKPDNRKFELVYFGADWCPYCIKMDQETWANEKLKKALDKTVKLVKINVDNDATTAREWKVKTIPTTFFVITDEDGRNTKLIKKWVGFVAPETILKEINDEIRRGW